MDKNEIYTYVMETPGNTNPNVLESMLDELEASLIPSITIKFMATAIIETTPVEYEYEVGLSKAISIMPAPYTPPPGLTVEGWYTDEQFTQKVEFPYYAQSSQTFYGKVVEKIPAVYLTMTGIGSGYPWDGLSITVNDTQISVSDVTNYELGLVKDLFASDTLTISLNNSAPSPINCQITTSSSQISATPDSAYLMDSSEDISVWGNPTFAKDVHITLSFSAE